MALSVYDYVTIAKILSDKKLAPIVKGAANGDLGSITQLINMANLADGGDEAKNHIIDMAKKFASAPDFNGGGSAKTRPSVDINDPNVQNELKDTAKMLTKLSLGGGTPEIVAQFVAMAAAEALGAGADIARNNGQKRAASNAALNNIASAQQEALHGPSRHARAAQAWGQEAMRRGENLGRGLDATSNVINKALGHYQRAKSMANAIAAGNTFGNVPSSVFSLAGTNVSNANK